MVTNGILNHSFALILIVIGLLSGALAVFRELQLMYLPAKVGERRVFWGWVRIAFVVAAVLLWIDEHSKVSQFQSAVAADFDIAFDAVLAGWMPPPVDMTRVIVTAQITNRGADSTANTYKLEFHSPYFDGNCPIVALEDNFTVPMGRHIYHYRTKEMLTVRTGSRPKRACCPRVHHL